ncbi:hypothetical protein GCM10017083_06280 [Thalassobaculum fulvum]|uniref:DUF2000 domain-containing protein n=1 Tax=Thalassobaculum fulvum TaxID=1633335 RepID=A0A918XPA4_9PROT|nr:DUF2000 family protein [Thalassobaculum fulvum]GHD41891.1 hypothetical protein GCM10017083_06280 [Thalassobaculum fulvum]
MSALAEVPATQPAPDIRVAVIVDPTLALGQITNTVAVVGVGIGAADASLGAVPLTDSRGRTVASSSNRPIPILQADGPAMAALLARALPAPEGATVVAFLRYGRSLHVFEEYRRQFPDRDLLAEPVDGIGLAGPARWVRSLTGSLKLLR